MICPIDKTGYCSRHGVVHAGPEAAIATAPTAAAEQVRAVWDRHFGIWLTSEKPKLTINELAAKRRRCAEAKAAGKPCNEFSPQTTRRFSMEAFGIGDALLGLVAIAGYKREHPDEQVIYGCRHHSWVSLFSGPDAIAGTDGRSTNINAGYGTECKGKAHRPRWRRYCDNIGAKEPAMPALRDAERLRAAGASWRGCIALAPFSIYQNRNWSVEGWLTLEKLLITAGHRCVIIHSQPTPRFQSERPALDAGGVASVLLNCNAFVGVDSGPAHLANLLGARMFVLTGPTTAEKVFYGPAVGISGHTHCAGCWFQAPYRGDCDKACASLWSINPREVAERLAAAPAVPKAPPGIIGEKKTGTLLRYLAATRNLPGDVAEFGVYQGGTAATLAANLGPGTLHLFDTFTGTPEDDEHGAHKAGNFRDTSAEIVQTRVPSAVLHVGRFPATADDSLRFRFAHVDMDTYQATRDAIQYLAPRMTPGGRILFDDYKWKDCPGVEKALREVWPGRIKDLGEFQALVEF